MNLRHAPEVQNAPSAGGSYVMSAPETGDESFVHLPWSIREDGPNEDSPEWKMNGYVRSCINKKCPGECPKCRG